MPEINFLNDLPKTKRNIAKRSMLKNAEIISKAREFGQCYFDGPREYGYGGYHYDGRWIPVAKKLITHYKLSEGMKVLDIGCAKGFLLKDLMQTLHGLEGFGIDISEYAIKNSVKEMIGRLHHGNAINLPFPDNSFDLVLSINTLHNLEKSEIKIALQEIMRVSKGSAYVVVDSYLNEQDKLIFEEWVLTARYHNYPREWKNLFDEAGYTGDYSWTLINN